jgi:hypothetical protein
MPLTHAAARESAEAGREPIESEMELTDRTFSSGRAPELNLWLIKRLFAVCTFPVFISFQEHVFGNWELKETTIDHFYGTGTQAVAASIDLCKWDLSQ